MQSLFNGTAWREHMQRQAAAEQADAEVHVDIKRAKRTRARKADTTAASDGVALTETSSRWKLVVHGPAAWPAHQLRLSRVRSIRLVPFWSYERADSLLVLEI